MCWISCLLRNVLGEKVVSAAPSQVDTIKSETSSPGDIIVVRRALRELEAVPEKSHNVEITIQFLHAWLVNANQSVRETRLLPNYPNPFNPETWIPYQLAEAADVSVTLYDCRWAFGPDSFCWIQTCRILSYTRASRLLGWTE